MKKFLRKLLSTLIRTSLLTSAAVGKELTVESDKFDWSSVMDDSELVNINTDLFLNNVFVTLYTTLA